MFRSICLLLFIGLNCITVLAGVDSSGGGPSVVKFNPQGQIISAQLLDIYEAPIRHGLKIKTTPLAADQILKEAVQKLKIRSFAGYYLEKYVSEIQKKREFLQAGIVMAPGVDISDGLAAFIPTGSQLLYAGFYQDDGRLMISTDIYSQLDEVSRAALILHEAIYKMQRDWSYVRNSQDARLLTALLLSDKDLTTVSNEVFQKFAFSAYSRILSPVEMQSKGSDFLIKVTGEMNKSVFVGCLSSQNQRPVKLATVEPSGSGEKTITLSSLVEGTQESCLGLVINSHPNIEIEIWYQSQLIQKIPGDADVSYFNFAVPLIWPTP